MLALASSEFKQQQRQSAIVYYSWLVFGTVGVGCAPDSKLFGRALLQTHVILVRAVLGSQRPSPVTPKAFGLLPVAMPGQGQEFVDLNLLASLIVRVVVHLGRAAPVADDANAAAVEVAAAAINGGAAVGLDDAPPRMDDDPNNGVIVPRVPMVWVGDKSRNIFHLSDECSYAKDTFEGKWIRRQDADAEELRVCKRCQQQHDRVPH